MSLQNIIKERLDHSDINQIAKSLRYTKSKLLERINNTVDSPYLGLDAAYYDFKYSQLEFVKKLCSELDIPSLLYEKVIDDIQFELTEKDLRFKPYIFIDTDFKRKNEPVIALAALESRRYIKVDYKLAKLPLNDQLEQIQNIIKNHYKNQKSLPMWGDIKQYVYHTEYMKLVFSTDYELLDVIDNHTHSGASVSLK